MSEIEFEIQTLFLKNILKIFSGDADIHFNAEAIELGNMAVSHMVVEFYGISWINGRILWNL